MPGFIVYGSYRITVSTAPSHGADSGSIPDMSMIEYLFAQMHPSFLQGWKWGYLAYQNIWTQGYRNNEAYPRGCRSAVVFCTVRASFLHKA